VPRLSADGSRLLRDCMVVVAGESIGQCPGGNGAFMRLSVAVGFTTDDKFTHWNRRGTEMVDVCVCACVREIVRGAVTLRCRTLLNWCS